MVYKNETVRVTVTLKDYDGALLTPDSQTIGLYKPDGTASGTDNTAPINVSPGIYYCDVTIPSTADDGTWKILWTVIKGGKYFYGSTYLQITSP